MDEPQPRHTVHKMKSGVSKAALASLAVALFLMLWITQATVGGSAAKSGLATSNILSMLEAGEIAADASDQVLRDMKNGVEVLDDGTYTVFSVHGLDATDNITLISEGGRLFYANFDSCSESRRFFKDSGKYSDYISKIQ